MVTSFVETWTKNISRGNCKVLENEYSAPTEKVLHKFGDFELRY